MRGSPGEGPPTTWDAEFSTDGTVAFVVEGTPNGTPGQPVQLASLFVVDLGGRRVTARIALGEYGGG